MKRWGFALVLAVICLPAGLSAQGRGNGRQDKDNTQDIRVIGRDEERIVREWFANPSNLRGLPPGLAKREQLPPGLQKQLARNGKLPPGLQKKIDAVPRDLEIRLPRLPDGRRRVIIGGNLIVLDQATSTILDVISNIF